LGGRLCEPATVSAPNSVMMEGLIQPAPGHVKVFVAAKAFEENRTGRANCERRFVVDTA
jgi:hypothetical protein